MMTAPNPAGLPELDIPGMIAMLKAQGYRVSKPSVKRGKASDYVSPFCLHCGAGREKPYHVIERWGTGKSGGRVSNREQVMICDDCYRFGPRMHAIPIRPSDPVRAARLMRVWRRAHNRFAARRREHGQYDRATKQAERLAGDLLTAMSKLEMTRDYVAESKIPGTRRMD